MAFSNGGYITVYEADEYLHLQRGTCREACLAGRLLYCVRPYGRRQRYMVRAQDAERLFGIAAAC